MHSHASNHLINKISASLLMLFLLMASFTAAADSTSIKRINVTPAKHEVVLKDCVTTGEHKYVVSAFYMTSAYPSCPENLVLFKVNLRTEHAWANVNTYVSLVCCKSDVVWPKQV